MDEYNVQAYNSNWIKKHQEILEICPDQYCRPYHRACELYFYYHWLSIVQDYIL